MNKGDVWVPTVIPETEFLVNHAGSDELENDSLELQRITRILVVHETGCPELDSSAS
jgi:hypothetical protein